MNAAAKALCEQATGAKLAFVQSDEISIVMTDFDTLQAQPWFDNNVAKIQSISASIVTAHFNRMRTERAEHEIRRLPARLGPDTPKEDIDAFVKDQKEKAARFAYFDSRAFAVTRRSEVINYLLWRQIDCTKNSISMAAQTYFDHEELHKINGDQMQEMLWSKRGVNWNDYPAGFKRGRVVVRRSTKRDAAYTHKLTGASLIATDVERFQWVVEDAPIFTRSKPWLEEIIPPLPE